MYYCGSVSDLLGPSFLPRDATQSAVLLRQVVCPPACPSVRYVDVSWSHRLEYFENNSLSVNSSLSADPNITDLLQEKHLRNFG